jgi:PAT family beta-lactamase induction signal transducer AmpG
MLFLGFSAGIPLLLIFSSLSLWLIEAGVERAAVTFFSWAALGYSFKFVWAPLVDKLPLPILTRVLGRRRSWLLLAQLAVIAAIATMAMTNPASDQLAIMALAAVFLGFSAATQDIVIDAYRIESAQAEMQALLSSSYIIGYRLAMIVSGAGALYIADILGSSKELYSYHAWQMTYLLMASLMLVGVSTTLIIAEPQQQSTDRYKYSKMDYLRFMVLFIVSVSGFVASFYYSAELAQQLKNTLDTYINNANLTGFIVEFLRLLTAVLLAALVAKILILLGVVQQHMLEETYIEPVQDFFTRYGWSLALLLLALIGSYRVSDIVLGVISNVFYQDIGFSKTDIATVVKTFGVGMSILGAVLGGILTVRFGVMKILFTGALMSAATNLLFMALAQVGDSMPLFYVVVAADNLAAGLASAAFVAFLSSLTNVSFTAMQYAIFSSLMTLLPKLLGGYSGTMVDAVGYEQFFLITALMGLPVLILIYWANKLFILNET